MLFNFGTWTTSGSANVASGTVVYRRATHDENGYANSLTKTQAEVWRDFFPTGNMTPFFPADRWATIEEIEESVNGYCKAWKVQRLGFTIKDALDKLVGVNLVEKKTV